MYFGLARKLLDSVNENLAKPAAPVAAMKKVFRTTIPNLKQRRRNQYLISHIALFAVQKYFDLFSNLRLGRMDVRCVFSRLGFDSFQSPCLPK